jgi:hypothetical protein
VVLVAFKRISKNAFVHSLKPLRRISNTLAAQSPFMYFERLRLVVCFPLIWVVLFVAYLDLAVDVACFVDLWDSEVFQI